MNRLFTYIRQSRLEVAKVVWPTRAQAARFTVAVILFSIVLALFIGAVDYVFAQIVEKLILKV